MVWPIVMAVSLLLATTCKSLPTSTPPTTTSTTTEAPTTIRLHLTNFSPLPIAKQLAEDTSIPTNVVGHLEDLEASTWVNSLNDLDWTLPPPYNNAPFQPVPVDFSQILNETIN